MPRVAVSGPALGVEPETHGDASTSVDFPLPLSPVRNVTGVSNSNIASARIAGRTNRGSSRAGTVSHISSMARTGRGRVDTPVTVDAAGGGRVVPRRVRATRPANRRTHTRFPDRAPARWRRSRSARRARAATRSAIPRRRSTGLAYLRHSSIRPRRWSRRDGRRRRPPLEQPGVDQRVTGKLCDHRRRVRGPARPIALQIGGTEAPYRIGIRTNTELGRRTLGR